LTVTCSIGLATYPSDGEDANALLANADAAMYRAKAFGRDNFKFYASQLDAKVHAKLSLQEELRKAILQEEFALLYQPQVDIDTLQVFAVEALIRWNHPTRGVVPPDQFIPLAEEIGLIGQIGDWALRTACKQNKTWRDAGFSPIIMSVNVSARQFAERDWVSRVRSALEECDLEPRYLDLELTESLIMQNVDQAIDTMQSLRRLGVKLTIDDFGTGYSSLSALKNFPLSRMKIDKSFVCNLPGDECDQTMAAAVISLAQRLNLSVIAEGVETREQMAFLRENGCREMQGFLFGRPAPVKEIEDLIKNGVSPVSAPS
jgi:EAL domain-containing protein (putative c-di-GMP-specific phosphodiesterase class I)